MRRPGQAYMVRDMRPGTSRQGRGGGCDRSVSMVSLDILTGDSWNDQAVCTYSICPVSRLPFVNPIGLSITSVTVWHT